MKTVFVDIDTKKTIAEKNEYIAELNVDDLVSTENGKFRITNIVTRSQVQICCVRKEKLYDKN